MPFDPRDFLQVATTLSNVNDEGSSRTSVSRSYYAVFLSTRARIEKTEPTAFKSLARHGDIHQAVIDKLKDWRWFNVADKLDGLRKMRRNADYFLNMTIDKIEAQNALALANNIYTLI